MLRKPLFVFCAKRYSGHVNSIGGLTLYYFGCSVFCHLVFVLHVVIESENVGPAGDQPLVVMHHVVQRLPVLDNKS